MADLTRDDIVKLAQLAHIQLDDSEIASFATEFNEILQYVKQLDAVDTDGLTPTSQVTGLTNIMRDDTVIDYGYQPDAMLRNAPQTQDNQLKVRRMIG